MQTTKQIIDAFRNKAGAWQSQRQADKLKTKLKEVLADEDYTKLSIAHSHYKTGEGATELYEVCTELLKKHK